MESEPIVMADVEVGAHGVNYFRIDPCPYCSGSHVHGAGRSGEDPRSYQGSRVSHCLPGGEYGVRWTGLMLKVTGVEKPQKRTKNARPSAGTRPNAY